MPEGTRAVGGAIIDVDGYVGPSELRALSARATDTIGEGAPVVHATSPQERTLSAARSIAGAGRRGPVEGSTVTSDFPFSHINDVESKLLEEIRLHLAPDATGTIHIGVVRSRQGGSVVEPIPSCSSCTNAMFQFISDFPGINLVLHAGTFPAPHIQL